MQKLLVISRTLVGCLEFQKSTDQINRSRLIGAEGMKVTTVVVIIKNITGARSQCLLIEGISVIVGQIL
jgi:hypothetical protein